MSVLLPAYNTKSILVLFGARFMIIFSMNNNGVFLQLGDFFSQMYLWKISYNTLTTFSLFSLKDMNISKLI